MLHLAEIQLLSRVRSFCCEDDSLGTVRERFPKLIKLTDQSRPKTGGMACMTLLVWNQMTVCQG